MSNWAAGMAEMDTAVMAEFSIPVVLHLPAGDKSVQGIFDNPHQLGRLEGGGHIASSKPELHLIDSDAAGIEQKQLVTVAGQQWFVALPPEPDGTGLTKVILGRHHESNQHRPDIRI